MKPSQYSVVPIANAKKILQTGIYKSVNSGLFKSLVIECAQSGQLKYVYLVFKSENKLR